MKASFSGVLPRLEAIPPLGGRVKSSLMGRSEHSIAAVSKLTGVSCHALRVWERRYGFPTPVRSASGHRRYTHEQVILLRNLAKLARSGHSIGELIADYQAGKLDLNELAEIKVDEKVPLAQLVDRFFEGDVASAEEILDRLSENLTVVEQIERVIEPALVDIGDRWFRGECDVFQERCAVSGLVGRLWGLLGRARRENRHPTRRILVGTVQGDRHEDGVIMVSLAIETSGWRAISLGIDLPVREYQKAIAQWRPAALALSFALSGSINKRFKELAMIRDVPVFVGGRSIVNHQGLARRHGLIPLTGTLSVSTSQMLGEFDAWEQRRAASASS
jgi:MerR family transcriptional regulator, light-induced transcriptional regulator